MKCLALYLALLLIVSCTSLKTYSSRDGTTVLEYWDFHPSDALMVDIGEALKAAVAAMSAQKLPIAKSPVTPVEPAVPGPSLVSEDSIALVEVESLHGSGFIWKPISESESKLVVLTPASWPDSTAKIGDETLRFTGRANRNRAHYRASMAGNEYPGNVILEVAGRKILVANPAQRYE